MLFGNWICNFFKLEFNCHFFFKFASTKIRNILICNKSSVWSKIFFYWFNSIRCVSLNSNGIHSNFMIHHRCLSQTLMSLKLRVDLENHTRWSSVEDVLGSGLFISVCLFFLFFFCLYFSVYLWFFWLGDFWRGLVFINAA